MKLGGKKWRLNDFQYSLTGHQNMIYWKQKAKFYKVYGEFFEDLVEDYSINDLEPKYILFRPVKWNSKRGGFT